MKIHDVRTQKSPLPFTSASTIDLSSEEVRENLRDTPLGYDRNTIRPEVPLEKTLIEIWSRVLNISYVSIYHNFFDLGGNALQSLEVSYLAKDRGLCFSPQQFFQYPTIHELAQFLQANR